MLSRPVKLKGLWLVMTVRKSDLILSNASSNAAGNIFCINILHTYSIWCKTSILRYVILFQDSLFRESQQHLIYHQIQEKGLHMFCLASEPLFAFWCSLMQLNYKLGMVALRFSTLVSFTSAQVTLQTHNIGYRTTSNSANATCPDKSMHILKRLS